MCLLAVSAVCTAIGHARGPAGAGAENIWNAALEVRAAESTTAGRAGYRSSSRLEVEFAPAPGDVHHYLVVARPKGGGPPSVLSVSAALRHAVVPGLMSDTSYVVDVTACHDAECARQASPALSLTRISADLHPGHGRTSVAANPLSVVRVRSTLASECE